jgi:hypothetical protein
MIATTSDVNKAAKASEERLAKFAAHTQSQQDHFGRKLDEVTHNTQKFVKDTVFPHDNRVSDLANKVTWRNNPQSVVAFQAKMDDPRAATAGASSLPANFQQMINSPDPVVRRAAFIGFPATTEAIERERLVNEFVRKSSPDFRLVAAGSIFTGPHDNRTLTPVAYAEFVTADDVRNFANKRKDTKVEFGAHRVDVRPARTKVNGQSNCNLRVAPDKLKAVSGGKTVSIQWKERSVTVDGVNAFKQGKHDRSGSFSDGFSHALG